MYDTKSSIRVAQSQVGYREGRSATTGRPNNDNRYSDMLPGFEWSDFQAWCCTFAHWVLWIAGAEVPKGARSASCRTSCDAYKAAKRFTEYPVVGGQIFFGPMGASHTGIVVRYDEFNVWTVEGNTNSTGSAEGDGVYEKKRTRRDPYVHGYGIPYYRTGTAVTPDPKWSGKSLARP